MAVAVGSTALAGALSGCDNQPDEKNLAPQAAELVASAPEAMNQSFEVISDASKISFEMDAEKEQITGRAPNSATGNLEVNFGDLTKSSGLIKIDLLQLSIYQKTRESSEEAFGKETKNEKQNEHMRTWLQISEDGPEEERASNRFAEFKIEQIEITDGTDPGPSRREVMMNVSGSLRLHGRVTEHQFPAQAVFSFQDGKPVSARVTSLKPIGVDLEKHDVRPRSAFNILADKTLDALGAKVAKVAQISLEIEAQAR